MKKACSLRLPVLAVISFLVFSAPTPSCNIFGPSDPGGDDNGGGGGGTTAYVSVSLANSTVEKFEYNSFGFNGSTSVGLRDASGTYWLVSKADMTKVVFYGKTWSDYFQRNCWQMTIFYSGTSINGWISSSSDYEKVTGNDLSTGAYKSVLYPNISQIVFYR